MCARGHKLRQQKGLNERGLRGDVLAWNTLIINRGASLLGTSVVRFTYQVKLYFVSSCHSLPRKCEVSDYVLADRSEAENLCGRTIMRSQNFCRRGARALRIKISISYSILFALALDSPPPRLYASSPSSYSHRFCVKSSPISCALEHGIPLFRVYKSPALGAMKRCKVALFMEFSWVKRRIQYSLVFFASCREVQVRGSSFYIFNDLFRA